MEETKNDIIIKNNLDKSILMFLGCIVFVFVGYYLFNNYESFSSKSYDPLFIKIVSLICIVFFGYIGIIRLIDLLKFGPALIINDEGIINNSNAMSGVQIEWNEITKIQLIKVQKINFILIHVKNPHKVIEEVGFIKRFWMNLNNKKYGTPICITTNTLSISAEVLLKLLKEKKKMHDL